MLENRASVNEISIALGQEMLKSKLQGVVNLVRDKQQQNPDLFADAPSYSTSLVVVDVTQGKKMLQVKLLKLAEELKTKQESVGPSSKPLETPWYLKPLDIQSTQKKTTSTKSVKSGVIAKANNLLSPLKISGTPRPPALAATTIDSSKSSSGKLLPLRPSMSPPHLPKMKVIKNIKVSEIKKEELGDLLQNGNHLVTNPPKPFSRFRRRNVPTSPTPSGRMAPRPPRHLKLPRIQRTPEPPTKSAFAPSFEKKSMHRKFVPAIGLPLLPPQHRNLM